MVLLDIRCVAACGVHRSVAAALCVQLPSKAGAAAAAMRCLQWPHQPHQRGAGTCQVQVLQPDAEQAVGADDPGPCTGHVDPALSPSHPAEPGALRSQVSQPWEGQLAPGLEELPLHRGPACQHSCSADSRCWKHQAVLGQARVKPSCELAGPACTGLEVSLLCWELGVGVRPGKRTGTGVNGASCRWHSIM